MHILLKIVFFHKNMSPWHQSRETSIFLSKDMLFLFPFFGDFHTGRNTNHAAATTTMTNTATGAEPFFVVPFPLTIFPVSSAPVSELAFAGPLTLSSGSILIAATSFPLSARSPPFCAFSSAESVPAALLPSVPGCAESPVAPP